MKEWGTAVNQFEIDKMNGTVRDEDGKIYWKVGKTYSSKLWDRLSEEGWKMKTTRNFVEIYNDKGVKVVDTIGIVHALKGLSELER